VAYKLTVYYQYYYYLEFRKADLAACPNISQPGTRHIAIFLSLPNEENFKYRLGLHCNFAFSPQNVIGSSLSPAARN